jgi:hypothetical protein
MESVESKLDQVHEKMHEGQKGLIKTIYGTMFVFAGIIISAFGVIAAYV